MKELTTTCTQHASPTNSPMPINMALYPSAWSWDTLRPFCPRPFPSSTYKTKSFRVKSPPSFPFTHITFTPRSLISSTSNDTTSYGRRYWGISDELGEVAKQRQCNTNEQPISF